MASKKARLASPRMPVEPQKFPSGWAHPFRAGTVRLTEVER
jgi:hypothetical protein